MAFDIIAILTNKSLEEEYLLGYGMGGTQKDTNPCLVEYKAHGAASDTQPISSGLEVCQMVSVVRVSPVMCKLSRRINAWLMKFSHAVRGAGSQVRDQLPQHYCCSIHFRISSSSPVNLGHFCQSEHSDREQFTAFEVLFIPAEGG